MKKLRIEIQKEKIKLLKKVEEIGLYENFGQNEVRKLEDKHIDISDYSDEMNMKRNIIDAFNNWCMNFSIN